MNEIVHTGKSQISAQDVHSRIESQFLQRYCNYIITDEFDSWLTPSYIHMWHVLDSKKITIDQLIQHKTNQINNQIGETQVFFALKNVPFKQFASYFDQQLEKNNVYSKEDYNRSIRTTQDRAARRHAFVHNQSSSFNQDKQASSNFYELYSNRLAEETNQILQGEIVIFESRIKFSSQKAKSLAYDIKQRIDQLFKSTRIKHQVINSEYIPYLEEYKYQFITVIILYNGDINHDFSKSLQMQQIQINQHQYYLKIKVYFLSKLALFSHFRETNKQPNIECITDKVIITYDLARQRSKKTKILSEIETLKKLKTQKIVKKRTESAFAWTIAGGVCLVAAIVCWKKLKINVFAQIKDAKGI